MWQRMKTRLGLEDEWDGYHDDYDDDEPDDVEDGYDPPHRAAYESVYGSENTSVRRVDRSESERRSSQLRSVPTGPASVSNVSPQVRIHITEPKSFGEAQVIADKFKQGIPVVVNLSSSNAELSKRLLDFAAGLTYGLDGGMQKVAEKVFLLTPANVGVSAEDRRRLKDSGLFSFEA